MKKAIAIILSLFIALSLTACGSSAGQTAQTTTEDDPVETSAPVATDAPTQAPAATDAPESTEAPTPEPTPEPTAEPEVPGADALVVYFSWSGNTEAVALEIQSQTGADVFKLVPAEPYTDDYDALLDIAREEQRSNARPAISGSAPNLGGYDTIYLGYPNWWGDMPMILYSFLDSYDLSGKTIAPFCTSGGSGFSGSLDTIRSMEPDATVLKGLHIGESSASRPGGAVTNWLSELGLTE